MCSELSSHDIIVLDFSSLAVVSRLHKQIALNIV